jgi:hypothetical protein
MNCQWRVLPTDQQGDELICNGLPSRNEHDIDTPVDVESDLERPVALELRSFGIESDRQ